MLLCEDGVLSNLKMESISWSNDMRKSIALCNDLVPVGRKLSGHADERKTFTDIEAAFLVRSPLQHPAFHLCQLWVMPRVQQGATGPF